jgi:hypothetical protein
MTHNDTPAANPSVFDVFRHGQHVLYVPKWAMDTGDADTMADWSEEVVIDEVIDDNMIIVRWLNSDATHTALPSQLSTPFGDPCRCKDDDGTLYCHVGN